MKRKVVYAVDGSARHGVALLTSVRSLRRWSQLAVEVHLFGPVPKELMDALTQLDVQLIAGTARRGLPQTALKWEALATAGNVDEVLFADTDTYFLRAAELLFENTTGVFCARREVGTTAKPHWCGGTRMNPQLHQRQLTYIFQGLRIPKAPIFNTGLMLVRCPLLASMGQVVDKIAFFCGAFERDEIPYPSPNKHIAEEIAATLALAHLPDFSWSLLTDEAAPFFLEFRNSATTRAIALHIWTMYYGDFLREYLSADAEQIYRRLRKADTPEEFRAALARWSY